MVEMIKRQDIITTDKMDGKRIPTYIAGLQCGAALDMTGYPLDYIQSGSLVIKDTTAGVFKPMPVTSDGKAYDVLPANHEYVGVTVNTKPKDEPLVGVMTQGVVIVDACFTKYSDALLTELKTALKTEFRK